MPRPLIAVAPDAAPPWVAEAVVEAGGTLAEPAHADGLVWYDPFDPAALAPVLASCPARWVQLPWAGIEPYVDILSTDRVWTCGKGVFAEATAEHALALTLALLRELHIRARATTWGPRTGETLFDRRVTILGGGGIAESLLALLAPFRCEVTIVRRHPSPMAGAAVVVGTDGLQDALGRADVVILALSLTPETTGIIGRRELDAMPSHAVLVNVARGGHVVTDELADALRRGTIAGAALDVTEPEPLPDGHPLWSEPRCLVTPHAANTLEMTRPAVEARVRENVRRFAAGEPLLGVVDVHLGY